MIALDIMYYIVAHFLRMHRSRNIMNVLILKFLPYWFGCDNRTGLSKTISNNTNSCTDYAGCYIFSRTTIPVHDGIWSFLIITNRQWLWGFTDPLDDICKTIRNGVRCYGSFLSQMERIAYIIPEGETSLWKSHMNRSDWRGRSNPCAV